MLRSTICLIVLLVVFIPQAPKNKPATTLTVAVRPTDLDVKGHVNNAKHIEYIQWGRWDWLEKHQLSNEKLAELNTSLVVVNINFDYNREVKYGDKLTVQTTVAKVGEKSCIFSQSVIRVDDGLVVASGTVTMVAVDLTTKRSRLLPPELIAALSN